MFFGKDRWRTVAIDTSHGWCRTDRKTGEQTFDGQHTILFQVNDRNGARRIIADDATENGRKFALEQHCDVALQRTKWEQAGKITHYDPKKIEFFDPAYAPHGDFEDVVNGVNDNPTLTEAMDNNPQVKQAWEHFVASVKMTKNL